MAQLQRSSWAKRKSSCQSLGLITDTKEEFPSRQTPKDNIHPQANYYWFQM